jgi:hypothetical protein
MFILFIVLSCGILVLLLKSDLRLYPKKKIM